MAAKRKCMCPRRCAGSWTVRCSGVLVGFNGGGNIVLINHIVKVKVSRDIVCLEKQGSRRWHPCCVGPRAQARFFFICQDAEVKAAEFQRAFAKLKRDCEARQRKLAGDACATADGQPLIAQAAMNEVTPKGPLLSDSQALFDRV
jgi:hypothetical protein